MGEKNELREALRSSQQDIATARWHLAAALDVQLESQSIMSLALATCEAIRNLRALAAAQPVIERQTVDPRIVEATRRMAAMGLFKGDDFDSLFEQLCKLALTPAPLDKLVAVNGGGYTDGEQPASTNGEQPDELFPRGELVALRGQFHALRKALEIDDALTDLQVMELIERTYRRAAEAQT